jgi:predicted transcriptional regulator
MKEIKIFNDPKAFEIAADKTRRRIIHLLRARELSVAQIASELEMTPQAIYHHTRKMLEVGLIEVAKEVRIEHFIETYYQTAAEIFQFNYDIESSKEYSETRFKETLKALNKIGLIQPIEEEKISKLSEIKARMNSIHKHCLTEVEEKIEQEEDLDAFGKQEALEIACTISMNDDDYNEILRLEKENRDLLKQYTIKQK